MIQKAAQSARPGTLEIGLADSSAARLALPTHREIDLRLISCFFGQRGDLGFGKEGLGLLPRITPLSLPKYPKPRSNLCVPSPRFECFVLVPESTPAETSFTPLFIRGYV